jgi:diguanylate cyclase (GGDEF)-like protein
MDEQLEKRIRECQGLPSLPAVAIQVLELVRDPRSELSQLARLVSKDPALASKILRTANSSIYSRPAKVSKLTQGLTLLGLQTVRVLVLGFSLVRNLKNYKNRGFRPLEYWRRAIYSATAALTLAQRVHLDNQEEAFVAALLMDIGMLALDELFGEQYGKINEKARSHSELVKLEESQLQISHAEVGGFLAEMWGLPAVLAAPMKWHHRPAEVEDASLRQLAQICYLAGRCADVFVEQSAATAIAELREYCRGQYSMTESDCDGLLNQISRRTSEIAPLFDIELNSGVSYEAILKKANDSVIQMTLASQEQARREKERTDQEALAQGPTRLASRSQFDELLAKKFVGLEPNAKRMALVMIEIDGLDSLRQGQGGAAASVAIQAVATIARAVVGAEEIIAHFREPVLALILPGRGRTEATSLAEVIRRTVGATPLDVGSKSLCITVSGGVAAVEPVTPFREPAHLIMAASLALDAAQSAGRDCVRAFTRGKPHGHSAAA